MALERAVACQPSRSWEHRPLDRAAILKPLVQACVGLNAADVLENLVTIVLARPADFDLTKIQVPVLTDLAPWLKQTVKAPLDPLHTWLSAVDQELAARAGQPPVRPTTWERSADIHCKCRDCQELVKFLKDPQAEILRRPMSEARRQHQHQIIQGNQLDTTHATERKGSPFTLVCSKTHGSHDRAVAAHRTEVDQYKTIHPLAEWHEQLRKKGSGRTRRKV